MLAILMMLNTTVEVVDIMKVRKNENSTVEFKERFLDDGFILLSATLKEARNLSVNKVSLKKLIMK